jgi:UDP-3-O-[3-hydroxymyristoyl] glucosamine N-acyltransferase
MDRKGLSRNDIVHLLEREKIDFSVVLDESVLLTKFGKFPASESNTLSWYSGDSTIGDFSFNPSSILICTESFYELHSSIIANVIVTDFPKFAFAILSNAIYELSLKQFDLEGKSINNSAQIAADCLTGEGLAVGANSVILSKVVLGKNVRIGANCVIGSPGFGFAKGPSGKSLRLPHIGGVHIGDNVEIGNNVCIDAGMFEPTVVSNDVKIDNLVHIAHNVNIGARTLVIAGSEISGSVKIGSDVWIAPHVSIIQKISIGDGALVGIGSTVTRDVDPGVTVFGSPARSIQGKN